MHCSNGESHIVLSHDNLAHVDTADWLHAMSLSVYEQMVDTVVTVLDMTNQDLTPDWNRILKCICVLG